MMDISHLYHDAAFGDPTLELDVKEQLKTREVNAREERNLQRMNKSYERAKCICEKNTAWERWKVGQSLHGIWERSPRLEKRLAVEKARIEALERRILYRNYRMPSNISNPSFGSRQPTSVSTSFEPDRKAGKSKSRNYSKLTSSEDDHNNERAASKQADFVRRSEHAIKALAKLNWKSQNRRRDHEKFKEELFFHSKPVIEKAKVVLKGRNDINVDNLYTDFESILLPTVKKPPSLNFTQKSPSRSQSLSQLSDSSVLSLTNSVEKKPFTSDLRPLPDISEEEIDSKATQDVAATKNADVTAKTNPTSSSVSSDDKARSASDGQGNLPDTAPPVDSQSSPSPSATTSNDNDSPQSNTPPTNQSTDSGISHVASDVATVPSLTAQSGTAVRSALPFSPPSSISQVIIEEEEDDLKREQSSQTTNYSGVSTDMNNNSINATTQENRSKSDPPSVYALTCTVGLPKLWKQNIKPKEKAPVEISASAIARKHRKKMKEKEKW